VATAGLDDLLSDVTQVVDAVFVLLLVLLGESALVAGEGGVVGAGCGVLDVQGAEGGLDDLELETALVGFVLDEGDCFGVALAENAGVVDLEDVVVGLEAGVEGGRVVLDVGDLVGAFFVAAHGEAEAVEVWSVDQVADACARNGVCLGGEMKS